MTVSGKWVQGKMIVDWREKTCSTTCKPEQSTKHRGRTGSYTKKQVKGDQ